MKKFKVTEINTTAYVYEVEAESEQEAEQRVLNGKATHLPEYDTHTERVYEFEEIEEKELCPHCKVREIEIDDLGYYGCKKCMPPLSRSQKERILDQDGTGQDWEVYG